MLSDPRDTQDPGSSTLVAILIEITLYFPSFTSIKDKRNLLRSLMEATFSRYRAAVSEIAHQESLERATLGAALVSGSPYEIRIRADRLIRDLKQDFRFQILSLRRTEIQP